MKEDYSCQLENGLRRLRPCDVAEGNVSARLLKNHTPRRVNEIILGRRGITADTAIRLAYFFGTSEEFWMGLQDDYELEEARHVLKDNLKSIVHPLQPRT